MLAHHAPGLLLKIERQSGSSKQKDVCFDQAAARENSIAEAAPTATS